MKILLSREVYCNKMSDSASVNSKNPPIGYNENCYNVSTAITTGSRQSMPIWIGCSVCLYVN